MKKNNLYTAYFLVFLIIFSGCSVKKNTGISRTYHNMTTKFNIYFNGSQSYNEGLENIAKMSKDDYSQILPLYSSSNHESLSSATSQMDRTIEKSRKAIKLHSIKKKPEKNYKKWNNPKYRAWYNQNEFNPALENAWLMLAQAEFHKGDFLGSVGTFSYIVKHYATVPDVVAEAQIWMARAYSEMDWVYEAEETLTKLSTEKLNKKNTGLFSAAMADVLLKKEQYKEAVPYLKLAIEKGKNSKLNTRYKFILAQIYTQMPDKETANKYYTEVIKSSPPYEMEFNARINRAQLLIGDSKKIEKELKKMVRSRKNKDYIDQIYGSLGNIFLNRKDTLQAIEYYTKAIGGSTKNGIEKGVVMVKLGDLYYDRQQYVKAEPNYNEASKIFTNEYFDFQRINKRAEVLAELVKEDEVVMLQDSLLKLSAMAEEDRLAAINQIIDNVKKQEKEEKEQQNNPANNLNDDDFSMPMANQMIGNNSGNNWYFYNANTVKSGKSDFRKKWGNRKLEDNWQRGNKSAALFADNNTVSGAESIPQEGIQGNDKSETTEKQQPTAATDNKSIEYYLQQIPFTPEQQEKSNKEIADALFNMGFIFKDKMEDYPTAITTFERFENRFPTDKRVMETLYQRFLIAAKQGDKETEEKYRRQILSRYPQSNYAQMLFEPNFVDRMIKMYQEQDSLYNQTYTAYTQSDFNTVFANTAVVKKNYPVSNLMPKFEFLNALSIGKTQKSDLFKNSLDTLVARHPQSDVSAMAKDILALMKQGNIAQLGKTHGTLLAKRAEETATTTEDQDPNTFSASKDGPHRLMFVGNLNDSLYNKLLYNIAMFNFSRFMIKDFDFETGKVGNEERALSVTGLESFDEVLWYEKTILEDKELNGLIHSLDIKLIPISDDNLKKLFALFTLDEYSNFEKGYLQKMHPQKEQLSKVQPAEVKKTTEKSVAKAITPTEKATDTKQKNIEKPEKPVKETNTKEVAQQMTQNTVSQEISSKDPLPEPTKPAVEEPVEWFRNTYAYRPNSPHFIALFVPNGRVPNFAEIQKAFDKYNTENYSMMNLKTSLETFGNKKTIIIGSFADANIAKSYLLRMLKEADLNVVLKTVNRRNLIGTQENLNTMVQKDDLNTYFEFMKEFYLN